MFPLGFGFPVNISSIVIPFKSGGVRKLPR
jgi:hypothetical protein